MKNKMQGGCSPTLIELLIIVAIVAILLAALSGPDDLTGDIIRRNVELDNQYLDEIAAALEAYRAENGAYPPMWFDATGFGRIPPQLTTPVGYLPVEDVYLIRRSYPADARRDPPHNSRMLHYAAAPQRGFLVLAPGPDNRWNIPDTEELVRLKQNQLRAVLLRYTYDPTNGALSSGDIWRIKH